MPRGHAGQRVHHQGRRGKLITQPDLWDAMTIGLALGISDYEEILAWPRHRFLMWQARFLIEPPDASNRMALARAKYEAPAWVQSMIKAQERIQKRRKIGTPEKP